MAYDVAAMVLERSTGSSCAEFIAERFSRPLGFFCFGYADDARRIAIAWVVNDAPPPWLQPSLSRALIAVAEGRAPEPLVAPPAADPAVDPSGTYRVSEVGELDVRRDAAQLRVGQRGAEYQGFPVARGVHCVPGLGAHLRFASDSQRGRSRWRGIRSLS